MRVKFGNKVFESDQIIHPGGLDKSLFVKTPNGTYEVMYHSNISAHEALLDALNKGYIDCSFQEYTNNSPFLNGGK